MSPEICEIGGKQVPYFRNERFSRLVLECEDMLLKLAGAPGGSRVLLLTNSGTGAMEAAIANFASRDKPSLVINSRGFGQRLIDICTALERPVDEFRLPIATAFNSTHQKEITAREYGAIICNAHDTVTGVRNDLSVLGAQAKQNDALFIVDAISSFLCDDIDMAALGVDVLITGSQKALALPPGLAILIISPNAIKHLRLPSHRPGSYYFDLLPYLDNASRGQTPFTPAVGIVLQLHARLKELCDIGVDECVRRTKELAQHFRSGIAASGLPFRVYPDVSSNGITALECMNDKIDATRLVRDIDKEYGLYLTPNGGELKRSVFRVSHMGIQTVDALDNLVKTLHKYVDEKELW